MFVVTPPYYNKQADRNVSTCCLHKLYALTLQVLFVCERIKFGDSKMDEAGGLTFVSALSREEVTKGGSKEVFLVSAAQVGVRHTFLHLSALSEQVPCGVYHCCAWPVEP